MAGLVGVRARLSLPGCHVPPTGLPALSLAAPAVAFTKPGSVLHLLFVQLKKFVALVFKQACTNGATTSADSGVLSMLLLKVTPVTDPLSSGMREQLFGPVGAAPSQPTL